jgi:hypothetical protein
MDYQTKNYSETLLPKNDLTDSFITLSVVDKMKVIELGMSMFKSGGDKLNALNNKDWAAKLESQKMTDKSVITRLRGDLDLINQEKESLINKYVKDIKRMKEEIRTEVLLSFSTELERLQEQRETLTQKLHGFHEKLLEQHRQSQTKLHDEMKEQREFYENKEKEIRKDFQNTIEKQAEVVRITQDNTLKKTLNSTIKGQTGEEWVYNALLRQLKTVEIEPTYKEKEKGDFVLKEPGIVGMIEAKSYKKNVPKKEIEKFYRDMDKNPEYNYGILASLDHGVVRREDFECEFRNGCPLIFLHRVREKPEKLLLAIKFCKLIEKNKTCIDITNEETKIKIQNLLKPIQTEYKQMNQLLSKFQDNMHRSIETQFENICGILDLLNIK